MISMTSPIKPSLVIRRLWQIGFFSKPRNLEDIRNILEREGINFSRQSILMAIKRSDFIVRNGLTGKYLYVQKIPPMPISKVARKSISEAPTKYDEVIYKKGHAYNFYKDIKIILSSAKKEVIVVDSYINEELFNLYLEKLPSKIKIKIITNPHNPKDNFYSVAKKFALNPKVKFELKESEDCHDRIIFVDKNAWVVGQSLKDGGKKPTYLIPVYKSDELKEVFREMWKSSIKINFS